MDGFIHPLARPGAALRLGLGGLLLACLLGLQACGGGTEGAAEAPPPALRLPELSGRVADGETTTDVASLQITVKGHVGTARTAEGRLAPTDGSDYLASLNQLSGPYLLSDSAASSFFGLYSVATQAGTANLTPLTTLLVAQLLGEEPGTYFAAQGTRGGFSGVDEAAVTAAEQRVRRYLKREFDFELPATLGNFVTTPFSRLAGDPMFDTLQALALRLAGSGGYRAVVTALAQESARCKVERATAGTAALRDDFCPLAKTRQAAADDASVQELGWTNRHGDALRLRLRGNTVLALQWRSAEGALHTCSDAGCAGITLGTPAGDGSQSVAFSATALAGADGSVRIDGLLQSATPGIALPGLACTDNRFFLIDTAAGQAQGWCATPDDFGLGAAGQSFASGATRRSYSFNDGVGGPVLEIIVAGSTVLRALVYTVDSSSGLFITQARFQCRGGGCAGITLGAATVEESLGVPIVLQPIRIQGAVLAAVLPDGSLSGTESVTLQASFTGLYVNDPAAQPFVPLACAAQASTVVVQGSEPSAPVALCEPDDTQGFTLRSASVDGDGNTVYSFSGLVSDGASVASGNSITLTLGPGGGLLSASFDAFGGPRYHCVGTACSGITVSAADAAGERSIRFDATQLQELGTAGLPADRVATLTGGFQAPPLAP